MPFTKTVAVENLHIYILIYYYWFISFTSYFMEQLKVMTRMTRYCMVALWRRKTWDPRGKTSSTTLPGPSRGTQVVQYGSVLIFSEVVQDKRFLPYVQHFNNHFTSPFLMIRNQKIDHLAFHNSCCQLTLGCANISGYVAQGSAHQCSIVIHCYFGKITHISLTT